MILFWIFHLENRRVFVQIMRNSKCPRPWRYFVAVIICIYCIYCIFLSILRIFIFYVHIIQLEPKMHNIDRYIIRSEIINMISQFSGIKNLFSFSKIAYFPCINNDDADDDRHYTHEHRSIHATAIWRTECKVLLEHEWILTFL